MKQYWSISDQYWFANHPAELPPSPYNRRCCEAPQQKIRIH